MSIVTVSSGQISGSEIVSGYGSQITVLSGGQTSGTYAYSAGIEIIDGGAASNSVVGFDGSQTIESGGVAIATTIGGFAVVSANGSEVDPVVSSGGILVALPGATITNPVVNGGGVLIAAPDASIAGAAIETGGDVISTGVVVLGQYGFDNPIGIVASASGTLSPSASYSYSLSNTVEYVLSGGTALGDDAAPDIEVFSGGVVLSGDDYSDILRAALIDVHSGGLVDDASVGNGEAGPGDGGEIVVDAGGVAENSFVGAFGKIIVEQGGFVSGGGTGIGGGITVDHGGAYVGYSGDGATVEVFGKMSGAFIEQGSDILISSGGVAFGTTIDAANVFVFSGGGAVGTTIELGGSLAVASGGIADGVELNSGGTLELDGIASGIVFSAGGTLELDAVPFANGGAASLDASTGVLTVSAGGTSVALDLSGNYTGETFKLSSATDGTSATDVTLVACFAEGTRILTDAGFVPVERLCVGDMLPTAAGPAAPVKWLGHRRIDIARHPCPLEVAPIRILQGAFGSGRPSMNLRLSPDHAIFAHGHLIPIRLLINGGSVAAETCDAVTHWHVELPAHAVIFAEGLEVESYLDTGNRGAFVEADIPDLHPSFAPSSAEIWSRDACAPLLQSGPILQALRDRLAERSAALGADCAREHAVVIRAAGAHIARIPAGVEIVRIVSEATSPPGERRRLGAAIASITLDGVVLPLDDARLARGFHRPEAGWRWTDGEGALNISPASEDERRLEIETAAVMPDNFALTA